MILTTSWLVFLPIFKKSRPSKLVFSNILKYGITFITARYYINNDFCPLDMLFSYYTLCDFNIRDNWNLVGDFVDNSCFRHGPNCIPPIHNIHYFKTNILDKLIFVKYALNYASKEKHFKIRKINVNGLGRKLDNGTCLKDFLNESNPDVFFLSETWKTWKVPKIQGYNMTYTTATKQKSKGRASGGVAGWSASIMSNKIRVPSEISKFKFFVHIEINVDKYNIFVGYCSPPDKNNFDKVNAFYDEFQHILQLFGSKKCILIMDTNLKENIMRGIKKCTKSRYGEQRMFNIIEKFWCIHLDMLFVCMIIATIL